MENHKRITHYGYKLQQRPIGASSAYCVIVARREQVDNTPASECFVIVHIPNAEI